MKATAIKFLTQTAEYAKRGRFEASEKKKCADRYTRLRIKNSYSQCWCDGLPVRAEKVVVVGSQAYNLGKH